jgi:hypothetical protein
MIQPFKGLESPVVILWGLDTIEEVVVIEARLLPGLRRQQRWLSICCLWASKTPGPGATICEFSQFFCEPTQALLALKRSSVDRERHHEFDRWKFA